MFRIMIGVVLLVLLSRCKNKNDFPYLNNNLTTDERVEDLLQRLTLDEKITLISTEGFKTKPIPRLNIPSLTFADGPVGVRKGKSTVFPAPVALAATFNPKMVYKIGKAIAKEASNKNINIMLAPCVNIHRLPFGGRNFESFGEDPYLTTIISRSYIRGMQKNNVGACIKHFTCNNQEWERERLNVLVDTRTLHELYFPSFKDAVQNSDVLAVMSAYNKVNGSYCSEHAYLLDTILVNQWGFKGLIISDWNATHNPLPTFLSNLDLEAPEAKCFTREKVKNILNQDKTRENDLNEKVRSILTVMMKLGLFDRRQKVANVNYTEQNQMALEAGSEGIVLLKNANAILPLDKTRYKKVLIVGENAKNYFTGAGGSSSVDPMKVLNPYDELLKNTGIEYLYEKGVDLSNNINILDSNYLFTCENLISNGLIGEYYNNVHFADKPVATTTDKQIFFDFDKNAPLNTMNKDSFAIRWSGYLAPPSSGSYVFDLYAFDGVRLILNGDTIIERWNENLANEILTSDPIKLEKDHKYRIKIEFCEWNKGSYIRLGWSFLDPSLIEKTKNAARECDMVIIFAGFSDYYEGESKDLPPDLLLPNLQDALIQEVEKVNDNVVVVLNSGVPININNWINEVEGLVMTWYLGQTGGKAIADVLSGNINPSGKLPFTYIKNSSDYDFTKHYKDFSRKVLFEEGIFVGYRYLDKYGITPHYPFGYGLSYTTFDIDNLSVSKTTDDSLQVKASIENTGNFAGAEVVQVYVQSPSSRFERPSKELKGFTKVFLNPGEEKKLEIKIPVNDLRFYNPDSKNWELSHGEYTIMVGNSSRDISFSQKFIL